jgi:hypothetical protein
MVNFSVGSRRKDASNRRQVPPQMVRFCAVDAKHSPDVQRGSGALCRSSQGRVPRQNRTSRPWPVPSNIGRELPSMY